MTRELNKAVNKFSNMPSKNLGEIFAVLVVILIVLGIVL